MSKERVLALRDFADFLKLEVSDIPPSQEKYIKNFVIRTKALIEEKYGQYFGSGTLMLARGLEERVVSFAPEVFVKYLESTDSKLARATIERVAGAYGGENLGYVIAIESRDSTMRHKDALEMVKSISGSTGLSLEDSQAVFKSMVFKGVAIHEMIHAYEETGLPRRLSEAGTNYYAIAVQGETGELGIIPADGKEKVEFYESLIERFGEDMHRLFFGQNKSKILRLRVFSRTLLPSLSF